MTEAPRAGPAATQLMRADAAWAAITAGGRYDRRRRLYGRRRPGPGPGRGWRRWDYETLWPFSSAWSAACTYASAPGRDHEAAGLASFFDGLAAYHRHHDGAVDGSGAVGFESVVVPPLGPGGDVYYDDNAWLGLALVRHHELCGDERPLGLARRVFAFVVSGWSAEPSWQRPGGIRWKVPAGNVSRNTCSNGPTAELAALLHRHTGDPAALEWAVRIYDWVRATLLGQGAEHGLYLDRITPDGRRAPETWTYNQGTMIGAGVLLAQQTGEERYLDEATATAAACLARFDLAALLHPNGPAFNAVFFRNLLLLDALAPDGRYRSLAEAYGEEMWCRQRHRRSGLYASSMSALNNTAPMVQLYALLAGAPPHV